MTFQSVCLTVAFLLAVCAFTLNLVDFRVAGIIAVVNSCNVDNTNVRIVGRQHAICERAADTLTSSANFAASSGQSRAVNFSQQHGYSGYSYQLH